MELIITIVLLWLILFIGLIFVWLTFYALYLEIKDRKLEIKAKEKKLKD